MKYNIGDTIKIRSDLVVWSDYDTDGGDWCYEISMDQAVREHDFIATIIDVEVQKWSGRVGYKLDIDPRNPFYCDPMIEKLLYKNVYDSQSILQFMEVC